MKRKTGFSKVLGRKDFNVIERRLAGTSKIVTILDFTSKN